MLGPLPPLYRAFVALSVLALCVAGGAWLTFTLTGPLLAATGAGVGAGIGGVVALLLLHDVTSTRRLRPQQARHRAQRRL